MAIFRTNKLTFEGLKLSLQLYRMEKSQFAKDSISVFAKTILYDVTIDISLLMTGLFGFLQYGCGDDQWLPWLFASAGIYGLEIINGFVIQYYYYYSGLDSETRARGVVTQAPKYILFNKKEKEMQFNIMYRKFMKGDFNMC